jgi:rubrerythrin
MPEFVNPFPGMVQRTMTKEELIRALRLNMAAELEATHLYMAHADATDDELARKVLIDIANEERVHVGEFLELIRRLAADEQGFLDDGAEEVAAMATGGTPVEPVAPPAAPMPDLNTTVGSLRELAKENG